MTNITEENFLNELLLNFPEFHKIHEDNKENHEIGIHLIFGDFRRFTENAIKNNKNDLLLRVIKFISKCYYENNDEVNNAVLYHFLKT